MDAASGEITGAVIGSTLTTVLVFVPLAFIVGVYGQFFAALSWSLSIAVLVSMVISLTLVPVFAAKFLAGRPMPAPGPIYSFFAHLYELLLGVALRFPWLTLRRRWPRVGRRRAALHGHARTPRHGPRPGQPPPAAAGQGAGDRPDAGDGRGSVRRRLLRPVRHAAGRDGGEGQDVEEILSENPDVEAYVRRTGAENGLFATQTSRGDIQVVLRPAEDDPISLLTKPVRPPLDELEKELKKQGKELDDKERARHPPQVPPPAVTKVMEEVEDEIKDTLRRASAQDRDGADHGGRAERPVRGQQAGRGQAVRPRPARAAASWPRRSAEKLEKKGKGRGIKEVNSNVREGNPDLMIQVDG